VKTAIRYLHRPAASITLKSLHNKRLQNDRTKSIALCLPSRLVGGI
jgi:hypothetical protein